MAANPLTQALMGCLQGDPSIQKPAEAQLAKFEAANLPQYMVGLAKEVANAKQIPNVRILAATQLKNLIKGRSPGEQERRAQIWKKLPPNLRNGVKQLMLQVLGDSQSGVRAQAARVVASIGAIDIPDNQWQQLIDILERNIQSQNEALKHSSFMALGYVCEACPDSLEEKSSRILQCIMSGMKDNQSVEVKLAAVIALYSTLEFCKSNFENATHRNHIMQMIYQSTTCPDDRIREKAFMCLVQIVEFYYEHVGEHMVKIFQLTGSAIKTEKNEDISKQAVEFWTAVAEIEMELALEDEDLEQGQQPKCRNYAKRSVRHLMPLLLESLTKQSEDPEDSSCNLAEAAGICLSYTAQCVKDDCLPLVLPFVQKNIRNPNWRFREASTLSFGCILEGPSKPKLAGLAAQVLQLLLQLLQDKSAHVKDTAAWTVSRVCEVLPEVLTPQNLMPVMRAFVGTLAAVPRVAAHIAKGIMFLAESIEAGLPTNKLSRYFPGLIGSLLKCSERPDANEGTLLTSAYEAVNALIVTAAEDMDPVISRLLPQLITKLAASLQSMGGLSGEERERQLEVQALLTGTLTTIIQNPKIDVKLIAGHADNIVGLFLRSLQTKNSSAREEVLMSFGALIERLNMGFAKYVGALAPHIIAGIKDAETNKTLYIVTVGVVSDLARTLEKHLARGDFCTQVMNLLVVGLKNPKVDRFVKPHIISAMGDIAMAIGGYFKQYMPLVMKLLIHASMTKFDEEDLDDEVIEHLNQLRESLFSAFTGILDGLQGDKEHMLFGEYVEKIIPFIQLTASDQDREEDVVRAAVGFIGDLCVAFKQHSARFLNQKFIAELVREALKSNDDMTQKSATFTKEKLAEIGLNV